LHQSICKLGHWECRSCTPKWYNWYNYLCTS